MPSPCLLPRIMHPPPHVSPHSPASPKSSDPKLSGLDCFFSDFRVSPIASSLTHKVPYAPDYNPNHHNHNHNHANHHDHHSPNYNPNPNHNRTNLSSHSDQFGTRLPSCNYYTSWVDNVSKSIRVNAFVSCRCVHFSGFLSPPGLT